MKSVLALLSLGFICLIVPADISAQSLGNAGTVDGIVADPSGAAVPKAAVQIHNPLTGYQQATVTDANGTFRFSNVPPNPYHLEVRAPGFSAAEQDVTVRSAVPI